MASRLLKEYAYVTAPHCPCLQISWLLHSRASSLPAADLFCVHEKELNQVRRPWD
jgi:hypothetical protein